MLTGSKFKTYALLDSTIPPKSHKPFGDLAVLFRRAGYASEQISDFPLRGQLGMDFS